MIYVLGFLFSPNLKEVCLIRKVKPEWMMGKWNGVGGKVELGEHTHAAMVREFYEETGAETMPHDWKQFAILNTKGSTIYVYKSCVQRYVTSKTEEQVAWHWTAKGLPEWVPNLHWLIPMALHDDKYFHTIQDVEA